MSVTMALGSFIAGATAEGGGAVAFPVMTIIFDISPLIARDFSLIIQAVGMNAAAFAIIASRTKVVWPAIITSGLGGSFGVYLGMTYFSGLLPPGFIKMFFVSFWLGFGFALWMSKRFQKRYITIESMTDVDHVLLFVVGIVGGIASGLTGSGLDIVIFSVLTLYYRICPTVATPTSVILMGNNALMGVILKTSLINGIMTQAIDYWLVCVPIVVIGAPLGALFMKSRSHVFIVNMLITIFVIQFVGALFIIPQNGNTLLFSSAVMGFSIMIYSLLAYYGRQ